MMRRPTLILIAVVSVLAVCVGRAAWAGPPSDQLRVQIDNVLKVFADPELQKDGKAQARRVAIRKIASDIFDFTEITKRSLGRHWQARTPAEQAEFVGLLTDLLERTYVSKIEGYTGEEVAFVGEALDSGVATVRTKIVTKQGTEIPVDYRMYQAGNRWLAPDVSGGGMRRGGGRASRRAPRRGLRGRRPPSATRRRSSLLPQGEGGRGDRLAVVLSSGRGPDPRRDPPCRGSRAPHHVDRRAPEHSPEQIPPSALRLRHVRQ